MFSLFLSIMVYARARFPQFYHAGDEVRAESAPCTNTQKEQDDLLARSSALAAAQTNMEDLKVHMSDHLDISKAFYYAKSARRLWLDLESRLRKKGVNEPKALAARYEDNRVQKPKVSNTESISTMLKEVYFVGHAPGRKRDLRDVGGSIPTPDPLTEEPSISAPVSIPIVSSSPRSADCSSPVLPYTTTYDHGSVSTSTDPSSNMSSSPHLPLAAHAKPSHYAFVVSLSNLQEPKTYVEANATEEWRLALRTRVEPYLESGSFASWKICYCLSLEVKEFLDRFFTIKDLGCNMLVLPLHQFLRASNFLRMQGHVYPAQSLYRRLVGHLLYLKFTRPDISHATKQLSQFLQFPYQQHWDAATHLVWYLNGSINKGLFFSATSPLTLKTCFDADWACCVDSHRSLTGYGIFLGHSLISWKTKKQNMVSRLTAEAKYRSMGTFVYKLS
ncbi:hypothetical protein Sango_0819400 [Sesamum angolense]|uniref:Mitochondrial protein n=1 Tax=Sesamum angolense TaxID=2727404 RepID=A0AAE2C0H0_9LAMI|nr:hypothetical protein Sango_0819400 [Sesamum angolense]